MPAPDSAPTVRIFIAVLFSPPLRRTLVEAIAELARATPSRAVQWVKDDTIHLTLKFLGIVRANAIPDISRALTITLSGRPSFEFTAFGLGCFPNLNRPRVVWAGITEGARSLILLQSAVEAALNPLGYAPEDRPYSPHITLGRVRREAASTEVSQLGKRVAAQPPAHWGSDTVDFVYVMKSELRAGGSRYTPLQRIKLS